MTTLPVFGGVLKREIVKRAYGMCGQAAYEFSLDPEEMNAGIQALNDAMSMLPTVPYNFPDTGDGNDSEESGLSGPDVLGAAVMVARLIAPQIGKTLTLGAAQANAERGMMARYNPTLTMQIGRNTIRGAGNRYGRWRGPFLPTYSLTPLPAAVVPDAPAALPSPTIFNTFSSAPQAGITLPSFLDLSYALASKINSLGA